MIKVSIIVPFYNVENYIEKCLETLVNQTLQEIEIILVNDGSKDNSSQIAKKYLEKYPKKIVYLEKENGGLSDARNYGIPYSKGEYIAFLDSDDYVEKDMYEKLYKLAKKEDSDMVQCNFYWEYPNKRKKGEMLEYSVTNKMLQNARVEAWNKLIKRETLQKANIQFPKGYRYEDVEFTYKLLPSLKKISFLDEPLIHYVQREGSISNSQNERTKEIFDVLEHVIDFYKEKNIYDKYKEQLEYIFIKDAFCSSFLRVVKIKDKATRKKMLLETWNRLEKNFPNWRKNEILKKDNSKKGLYLKSINKVTYKIYSAILSLI